MALNRFTMSWVNSLLVEELSLSVDGGGGGGPEGFSLCNFVSAVCADEMSLFDSAVSTLEMNWPSGLLESALAGVSCSSCVRYDFALVVSPD